MSVDIQRLIAPRSIALIGAGAWTDAVEAGNAAVGYTGVLWRVHPTRASTAASTVYRSVAELPAAPDAAFIAVPKQEVAAVAGALAARGAGGFVCFTAGFSETGSESGLALTRNLVAQAGALPFFGPNCYGFVNFFDRAAMLPDQVVGPVVERGVALLCQSGTIALTLMFSDRSLPIGCLFTVGNQTCLAVEDLIEILCDDPRVTAFGLYLEGIKDAAAFARAADKARARGKPIAVVKSGRTAAAVRTAHSHTGALAGEDSVFDAFCRQAGLARCDTLSTLCETLKLLHAGGALSGRRIFMMGASGGDMAMTADVSRALELDFAAIPAEPAATLRALLTDRVTVANPLDFHTYLWFDPPALGRVFDTALAAGYDAVGFVLDSPPEHKADCTSFDAVIEVFVAAAQSAAAPHIAVPSSAAQASAVPSSAAPSNAAGPHKPARAALIASLPETLSARTRQRCMMAGVVPLQGLREALEALALAAGLGAAWSLNQRVALHLPRRGALPDFAAAGSHEAAGKPEAAGSAAAPGNHAYSLSEADGSAAVSRYASSTAPAPRNHAYSLSEADGKRALGAWGVRTPLGRVVPVGAVAETAADIGFPVVIKAVGAHLEHKTEVGGVVLNVRSAAEAEAAALRLAALADVLLVEEMVTDGVAEILIGILVDPQFGQVLVLGAGGVLTELKADSVTLLPPWTRASISAALNRLAVAKLLQGYRGSPPGDVGALVDTILGVARYAAANVDSVLEIDVNPVIVRPVGKGAVAVDALIRLENPN